jgi:hypothetical protein
MMSVRKTQVFVSVFLGVLLLVVGVAAAKPTRVMIVVMDQMRPEYAQQYGMQNVLWLQHNGVNFKNATVGDMASETVVSHNVMVSGLFPKHMGWADEVTRDVGNALGYGPGAIITTGDLGFSEYVSLIQAAGNYPKLGDYLRAAFPGTIVANVGQKGYQVESMAAESSDIYVRMGSKKPANPVLTGLPGSYRGPSGVVPSYISSDPRYFVSIGNDNTFDPPADYYGTKTDKPAWLYPEDGRYVPGPYAGHESGDAWVADAAMAIMGHEDWSGMFITMSAMDKIGHLWGGGLVDDPQHYTWDPQSMFDWVHMPFVAWNVDHQLGRIIAKLDELGQLDDTLIVLTADHGSQDSVNGYYGVDAYDGGTLSWYYDPNNMGANTTYGRVGANNAAVLSPLNANGNLAYSYQSTAIEAWLIDQSWGKKLETAAAMRTLPGVIATYGRKGSSYRLVSTGRMTPAERSWWASHGQAIVDTMACDGAADVVGLLKDRISYGVYGDHGGAQGSVQRIPMVMYAAGVQHADVGIPIRLADLMPTVLRNMGIRLTVPVDGKAYNLPKLP